MKKRVISLILALCLLLNMTVLVTATGTQGTIALDTIRALGIIAGDSSGNLNLSAPVTRAEFVTMMTAASSYRDSVGQGSGVSLFKDVKSAYWAGAYIKLAVEQGWMSGYVDGTFRPDQKITLEEACTALLKLLDYDISALAGAYPDAQLSKALSLGLRDDVMVAQGKAISRSDCVQLFYNLLRSSTNTGVVYATTLGYTIKNGQIDYSTLVSADTKGPFVAYTGEISIPFDRNDSITVYRNSAVSSLSAAQSYDVYYYNSNLRTVWLYSNRISGTLTSVSPSAAAPNTVTVAGSTYSLGTSAAVYQCSSQGSFGVGSLVTLLLGMNGEVVEIISAAQGETVCYGTVLSSQKVASTTPGSTSSATVQVETKVACTDATVRTFYTAQGPYSVGNLVSVTVNDSGTNIKSLQSKSLSGSINSSGTSFAGYAMADGIQIIDTDGKGGYVSLYASRLGGSKLSNEHVLYYTLDEAGAIDRLILRNATGDIPNYVYVSSVENNSTDMNLSATYTYYQNGQQITVNSSSIFSVSAGGAAIDHQGGTISSMRQLTKLNITQLGQLYAMVGNQKYDLSEQVQVLLRSSGSSGYYATTLSALDSEQYTLTGWYDNLGYPAGGNIRIIVATEK